MKSIEEKAKAYDLAIEAARCIYNNMKEGSNFSGMEDLEVIFPELKESEDERIRKELIADVKEQIDCIPAKDCRDKEDEKTLKQLNKRLAWLEKQGKQKPKDKVEQKLEVGDWIVKNDGNDCFSDGSYVLQIMGIYDEGYTLSNDNFLREPFSHTYRLWTIQDAKEGDVLADDYGIYIFEKFDECDENCFVCIGAYQYSKKIYECEHMLCSVEVHPATKEQRDMLFQKMREAAYEWDAEKKELKKIEQNPAWSDEDEQTFIKSVEALEDFGKFELADWLKEHKNHFLRPQNTWKPSDEQIKSLQESIGIVGELTPRGECLKELAEQLKKLMEE